MKRIKPSKSVWIKRIHIVEQTYDFIKTEENNANKIVESTKDITNGTKFERAGIFYTTLFNIKNGLKSGWIRDILLVIITILLSYFIPKILG